jgi:pyroglutamyl-peptidase
MSSACVRILVTAFGAFPGAPRNPTLAIARQLAERHQRRLARLGIDLQTQTLPVDFARLDAALLARLSGGADVIVHLGLAGARKVVSVETRALNKRSILRPDAMKARAASRDLEPGPFERRARWPAQRLASAMKAHILTQLSRDAGDYLCNQTLWLTLGRHRGLAGFVHVPHPGAALPLEAMTRAIVQALILLAAQHRQLNQLGVIGS